MTQYFDVIKGELINLSDSEDESESEEQSKGSAKMVSLNGESNKEEDVDEYTKEIAEQKQVKLE